MDNPPLQVCPYDESHVVSVTYFPYHLSKCKKNHPNVCKKTCPYDSRHIIDESEFEAHLEECPLRSVARHEVEAFNVPAEDVDASWINEENVGQTWDNETDGTCCNPLENRNQPTSAVLHQQIGLSKARRREFKFQQRMLFSQEESKKENEQRETKNSKTKAKVMQRNENSKPLSAIIKNSQELRQGQEDWKPLPPPHGSNSLDSSFKPAVSATGTIPKNFNILKEKFSKNNTANDQKNVEKKKTNSSLSSKSKEDDIARLSISVQAIKIGHEVSTKAEPTKKEAEKWQVVGKKKQRKN